MPAWVIETVGSELPGELGLRGEVCTSVQHGPRTQVMVEHIAFGCSLDWRIPSSKCELPLPLENVKNSCDTFFVLSTLDTLWCEFDFALW